MAAPSIENFIASESVTTSAVSAQSGAIPAGATHAWVIASAAAWITLGANPTAVAGAANNILIGVTDPVRLAVKPGQKVAAIQDAAGGKVCICYVDGIGF